VAKSSYDPELKAKALTIAAAVSISEAARVTGVPAGTIKRWRSEEKERTEPAGANRTELSEPNRTAKKLKDLQQKAVEQAVAEAGVYIADRLKGLADDLYCLAEKAVVKVDIAIRDPLEAATANDGLIGEPHDRDGAAWLRSLVGVMAQAIDKAQLLSGKPTARAEVTDRHEYEITQHIIAEQPQLIDRIFAQDQQRGLADRSR